MLNNTVSPYDYGLSEQLTQCRDVHQINKSQRCAFVNSTSDCHNDGGFIDYTNMIYCTFGHQLLPLSLFLLGCWITFLFIALAVAADSFFCPALTVISKILRLSDNIAGVTLLAFGNGAPDVFSAIAAIRGAKQGDVGLAFGALLGAGVFLTTVVAGSVCVVKPFKMMERPFLRDVVFYLGSVFMTFYVLCDGLISLKEAICYIMVYVGYVIVVILARFIRKRLQKAKDASRLRRYVDEEPGSETFSRENSYRSDPEDTFDQPVYGPHQHENYNPNLASRMQVNNVIFREIDDSSGLLAEELDDLYTAVPQPPSPCEEFGHAISPIDISEWKSSGTFSRIICVFKGIALFTLRLTVPLVDYEKPKNNWNKHLNCLHCIVSPLVAIYIVKPTLFTVYINGHIPVWAVVLISGFTLSLVVFLTSTPAQPPRYHAVFSFVSFIVAVVWIQCIATEVVNLLQTFGVVFNINNAVLGLTLLAMGNSIGDLTSDISMARQGYPRTAISACYGGPMFNLLLGVGIPFTILCGTNGGTVKVSMTIIELVLVATLFVILTLCLVVVPFVLKFNMTRKFGGFLFILYVSFIIVVVLAAMGVISGKHFFLHWCHE